MKLETGGAPESTTNAGGAAEQVVKRAPYEPPRIEKRRSVARVTLLSGMGQQGVGVIGMTSTREAKEEIHYLDDDERSRLVGDVLGLRPATYAYRAEVQAAEGIDGGRHLGFIIEDAPDAVFVRGKRVDLYGLASALAVTVQDQARRIEALEQALAEQQRKA